MKDRRSDLLGNDRPYDQPSQNEPEGGASGYGGGPGGEGDPAPADDSSDRGMGGDRPTPSDY